jgi:O-antigen ligase
LPSRPHAVEIAVLAGLTGAFTYTVIQRAGVDPQDWNLCLLLVGVTVGIYGALASSGDIPRLDRISAGCIVAVLGLAAFQLIPLPIGIVRVLSPMRFELGESTSRLMGYPTQTLTLTATPYETSEYLLTLSGYALVVLFVRHFTMRLRNAVWLAIWPLLAVSGLEAALGCYQAYAYADASGARGTYQNRDHFAGLLEMAVPLALTCAIASFQSHYRLRDSSSRPPIKGCLAILIFALLLAGVIQSLCRVAFITSLAAMFVVLATVFATRNWHEGPLANIRQWPRWVPVTAVAAVVVLCFMYLQTNALAARFADLPGKGSISADTRTQIWRDTTRLVRDYPIFGCGLGSYGSCFLRYKIVAPEGTVDYAHNDYLQVLAEFGVFGFGVGLFFIIRILRRTVEAALYADSADNRLIAIGCLGAATAILLHSFVDFNMYVPANGFEFAWILGVAAVSSFRPHYS